MKFKIDENLSNEIADDLRALGLDADTVHDEGLTGAPDAQILAKIKTESRVLLTLDKGIADVRRFPPDQYSGIVLFRPPSSGRSESLPSFDNICRHCFYRTWTGSCLWCRKRESASGNAQQLDSFNKRN